MVPMLNFLLQENVKECCLLSLNHFQTICVHVHPFDKHKFKVSFGLGLTGLKFVLFVSNVLEGGLF